MFPLFPSVLKQIAFSQSLRVFVRGLLGMLIPDLHMEEFGSESDAIFERAINEAIYSLDAQTATERDCLKAVVAVACNDASRLCTVIRNACRAVGLEDIAEKYLVRTRLIELVLKRDESKMDALKGILASGERDVDIVFFRIAAVLKGEHIDCASIPAEARRKVKDDLQAVAIAVRQTVEESFDAKVRPIGESIGILGRKVDAIGRAVSRRGAAGSPRAEARRIRRKACVDLWEREQRNFQLRGSLNTRLTYKAVYELHRHELEGIGVATLGQFRSCMHAGHCKRSRDSIKALQSRTCASPPEPQIPKDAWRFPNF